MLLKSRNRSGAAAENAAYKFLKRQGLKLVAKNYSCRFGEIDLLMQDKQQLVCVEVRYRGANSYCHPLETINKHKRRCLIKTAAYYMQSHNPDADLRFDVVAITENKDLDWIKHAFLVE